MAVHNPVDYKLVEAKKEVDNLLDVGRDGLIKYYIEHLEKQREKDSEKIKEYQDFFEKLNKFLPNNNNTVYGSSL